MRSSKRQAAISVGGLALFAAIPLMAETFGAAALVGLANRVIIYAIAAVSLDLVLGYGAMVSFGHAMFFGLGGYMVGIMAYHGGVSSFAWMDGNSALLVWPVALAACAVLAVVVGIFALRTSGVQFIMITLAFAQLLFFVLVSLPNYGGDDGLSIDKRNALPFVDLASPRTFYFVSLGLLVLWTSFCFVLTRSRFGMIIQALRQNERRAVNLGVRVLPFRLTAFVISAVGTGLAGILWANFARFVTPDMASWAKSGEFMAMVILGGLGTLLGPIAGAFVFLGLERVLTIWTEHWMIVMGPVLVLISLFGRRGLIGGFLERRDDV